MAGVFKSLDQSDVRITPFRTHKRWYQNFLSTGSGNDSFTLYQANYNPYSNYLQQDPLKDTFDLGNPYFDSLEPTTSQGQYQRVVHRSIDHLYYRDWYTNTKATFGTGNINTQKRFLEDQAFVISMPQSKFGETVLPGSIRMNMSWSYAVTGSGYANNQVVSGTWAIVDDLFGNLVFEDNQFLSPYGQLVGGAYTNYTSSVNKNIAGEWPFEDLYKFTDSGLFNLTSSFNKGSWSMESIYTNVRTTFKTGSASPTASSDIEMLGAVMLFTSSLSSSIEIKPNLVKEYNQRYNFEGEDFAISMVIIPTNKPTHTSGSVLISKQGPIDELKIDLNGNIHSAPAPTRYPYRLSYTSGSCKLNFERTDGISTFSMTSSVSMSLNIAHHITAVQSGSQIHLYVNNKESSSIDIGTITVSDRDSQNQSNIFIGNTYAKDRGFDGVIDNVKLYKDNLNANDVKILHHTLGVGNILVGNAYYNHGMSVISSIPTRYGTVIDAEAKGTLTIYENEISCTISPGDFGMSSNPTLQQYDPIINEYVYSPFVTSSFFKPFVTTVGLYDDRGNLLVVGKLNMPIQLPDNLDTTIIIRYDK
jgi:hypothetical protein